MSEQLRWASEAHKKIGWTIDTGQIEEIKRLADNLESVSDEQVEAVILAMIDLKMIPLPVERGDIPTWQEKLAAEPSSDLACLRDEDPLT
jgi:hypothetical protein